MRYGAATAAYQIEGGWDADGKGPRSGTFVREPGRIANGETGDVARPLQPLARGRRADGRARPAGVPLLDLVVARAAEGEGRVNEQGLAFYDGLVDALLEHGIEPWVTPPPLERSRSTSAAAGSRRRALVRRVRARRRRAARRPRRDLADVERAAGDGGRGLPHGRARARTEGAADVRARGGLAAARARGGADAVRAAAAPNARVGIALNMSPVEPATTSEEDAAAARRVDGALNRWFLDPVFGRGYPEDLREWYGFEGEPPKPAPPDVIGVNYYFRQLVRAEPARSAPSRSSRKASRRRTWAGRSIPTGSAMCWFACATSTARRCSP